MRLLALTLAAHLALLPAAWAADPPAGAVTGTKPMSHPAWFKESFLDINEDVSEAASAGRHVMLFLDMNGCPYCYKMAKENLDEAPYRDWLQAHFDVIAINVRGDREVAIDPVTTLTEKALAEQLGVRYTPTVIFLNQDNEPVARVNGYRNVTEFKQVLDYVAEKAYQSQTLAEYLETRKAAGVWQPKPDPLIREAADLPDLAAVRDRPLALLFEDGACVACAQLHEGHLADPAVRKALGAFTVVRLDPTADTAITAPDGTATTAAELAKSLGVVYRPTLVLFDGGEERARVESMLYRYHFTGVLEYVGERHYQAFPNSPFDYINDKTAKLTAAGQDVSISDE